MCRIFIFFFVTCILKVESATLDGKVQQYFSSDVFKAFQKQWQGHRKSFENAIVLALKDNYGHRGMNVYVRRSADSLRISKGFFLTDNVVDLLLFNMILTSLPHLNMPEVTFALASNVLRMEAGLSQMIVETSFALFRNQSDILYTTPQNAYETSPFAYKQVDNGGKLAIIADGCRLDGYALAKMSGQSINLGHDTFQVKNCKFTVEISWHSQGSPPVIAPYFSKKQGKELEFMLTKPIRVELMPKLQAAVFTYVNTSLIFGDHLAKFREYQNDIFKETTKNTTIFVRNINNVTLANKGEFIEMEPLKVLLNYECPDGSCRQVILVDNVTLHGLDTLYSAQSGGPFKFQTPMIAEAIRFNSIMVNGHMLFEDHNLKEEYEFFAEIKDVTVNLQIDLTKYEPTFDVMNWRTMECSVIELQTHLQNRSAANAFVGGYLLNKVPAVLERHLIDMYVKFRNATDQKLSNVNVHCH
ncbi:uncharacterized protein LOC126773645 isoform X2 [Nymphalis io]|uniref:uncharacterized protein LOC126773645 isoform X2 n=1 Tax=Inachis io TaxID=171585 RepID=UPI00216994A2|nr:uncharacterized protein LOC126773645 isoform X2 [Nymphalis io]